MTTIKKVIHYLLMNQVECRPRLWVRIFRPFYTKCAFSSKIYFSARMDVVPFSRFVLGRRSVIESYSCINNAVGHVIIGERTRIGLGNTIIGPVKIGNDVNLAQSVVVTALNHKFDDSNRTISQQGIITKEVIIEDDVWIGANSTILPGVHIGSHVVIGAGSVVTHDLPANSLAVGIPARIIRNI